jgi:cell division protein FtsB
MLRTILILILFVPTFLFAQESKKENKKSKKKAEQAQQDKAQQDQKLMEKQAEVNADTDRVTQMIGKYGKNKGRLIAAGKIWTAISTEMAIDSWGDPVKKEKTLLNNVTSERWFYDGNRFLYFEDDRLVSWRE